MSRVTTIGPRKPAPPVARPSDEVGTARWTVREILLLIFCRLENEAWYEVRRVHRTPVVRLGSARPCRSPAPLEWGRPAPEPRRRGGGSGALLRRSMTSAYRHDPRRPRRDRGHGRLAFALKTRTPVGFRGASKQFGGSWALVPLLGLSSFFSTRRRRRGGHAVRSHEERHPRGAVSDRRGGDHHQCHRLYHHRRRPRGLHCFPRRGPQQLRAEGTSPC